MTRRAAATWMVVISAVGAIFLLANLGDAVLWVDEADTACIARNILKYGLPVCWDHGFLIEAPVTKYAPGWIWNQHPWLMHYLMAASFAVSGRISALTARLPFAILGIATLPLTYLLARRAGASRRGALLSAALLLLNVQFLLFARQARYFALLAFTTTLLFLGFLELERRRGLILFIVGAVALFHSNYMTFFPIGAALWAWAIFVDRDARKIKRLAVATGLILILTIPWMFKFDVFAKKELVRQFSVGGFLIEVKEYAAKFNRTVFPLALLVILGALASAGYRKGLRFQGLILAALGASIIFVVPASVVRSLRYLVGFFPALCVAAALIFEDLWNWRRPVAVLAAALFLVTTIWSEAAILPSVLLRRIVGYQRDYENVHVKRDMANRFLRVEWADFYRELRSGFHQDPLYNFIGLIKNEGRSGDLVVTSHYSTQIDFYTRFPTMAIFNWQDRGFEKPRGYLSSPEGFERIWYMRRPTFALERFEQWVNEGVKAGRLVIHPVDFDEPDIAVGNDPDLDTRLDTRESIDRLPRTKVYLIKRVPR